MSKSRYLFLLSFLIILFFLYLTFFNSIFNDIKTGFFALNPLKKGVVTLTSRNGVETINLSDVLSGRELNYGNYSILPKVVNNTLSILLKNNNGSFFSRFKINSIESGPFIILDSDGGKKDYYLNADANLSSGNEEEKSYIVEFKDPPMAVEKKSLENSMNLKISQIRKGSLKKTPGYADFQRSVKSLEADMNNTMENNDNLIRITHESFKKEIEKIKPGNIGLKEFTNVFNGVSLNLSQSELESIKKMPYVANVYEDKKVQVFLNDSVRQINATDVWNMLDDSGRNVTGYGVKIAIIDTGVDYTHPDLGNCTKSQFLSGQCNKVIGGYDFVNNDNDPMDNYGHGTHCASIAAGNGSLKGVAPGAEILAYKVLDQYGYGDTSTIIEAIERAVNDSADVISMSLGENGGSPDDPLSQAVDNAVNSGVVAVIAAGNSGPGYGTVATPANAIESIAVGAVDKHNEIADFSSRGPVLWNNTALLKPTLVAPGVDICAAEFDSFEPYYKCIDNKHISLSGTSMATPHVAGVVALLKQLHKDWTVDQIKSVLVTTSTDLGYDLMTQGTGLVNALHAANSSILITPYTIDKNFVGDDPPVDSVPITIDNLRSYQISINVAVENATDEYGGVYNVSYANATNITIDAYSEATVLLTFNMTGQGGVLFGKMILNADSRNYTLPYVVTSLRQLDVSVLANSMDLYPDLYMHTDDLSVRGQAYQEYDFLGPNYTFVVPTNKNITVYAIGDILNESLTYIMMKRVSASAGDANVTLNLSSDSRPFTINATSIEGTDLKLYELEYGFASYTNDSSIEPIEVIYSSTPSQAGDQTIYLSSKPEGPYDTDIILKYVGVPVKNQ